MPTPAWLLLTTLLALGAALAVAVVSHRHGVPMADGLTVASLGVAGSLAVDLAAPWIGTGTLVRAAGMTVSILVIAGWVYLIARYTDNDWAVDGYRIYAVAAPMAAVAALYWIEGVAAATTGPAPVLVADLGPWMTVYNGYSYLLTAASLVALAGRFGDEHPFYRRRAAVLAAAPLPPALLAAAYLLESIPLTTDLTAVGYTATTLIALYGLKRYDLLDVVPLARETTVNSIDDGVLAVTADGVVATVNDPGKAVLSVTDDIVGRPLSAALAGRPELVAAIGSGDEARLTLGDRHVQVQLTPIETGGARLGTVVHLKDVTSEVRRREEIREQQRRLERKNEQLDEFASVVSHDIRNPLAVARGHFDVVAEGTDHEASAAYVREAHERIEHIVEDLLVLAREGRHVTETEPVGLRALLEDVRDTTAVGDDAVEFRGPETVTADRSRLRQLLENLFRNAVEHAGPDVSVRVGPLADEEGFYVEDDGPGISPEDRERVFEHGYTDSEDGTGLGLDIVRTIAEAHGWEVQAVEGSDGGARFEFGTEGGDAAATRPAGHDAGE